MESGNTVIGVIGVISGSVDSNLDPSEQSIVQTLTEVNILREGIVSAIGLQDTPHIVGVGGDSLRVGVVGVGVLHGTAEHLVPEELADVGDATGVGEDGLVGQEGCVQVGEQVGVRGATLVVAGEDAFEGCDAVAVGLLDPAQVCRVPAVCGVVV